MQGIVLLEKPGRSSYVLKLLDTLLVRLQRSGLRDATEPDVVGNPEQYLVFRVNGNNVLMSARAARTVKRAERWMSHFRTAA